MQGRFIFQGLHPGVERFARGQNRCGLLKETKAARSQADPFGQAVKERCSRLVFHFPDSVRNRRLGEVELFCRLGEIAGSGDLPQDPIVPQSHGIFLRYEIYSCYY